MWLLFGKRSYSQKSFNAVYHLENKDASVYIKIIQEELKITIYLFIVARWKCRWWE